MAKQRITNDVVVKQPMLSDKVVPVPRGNSKLHDVKRIRILTPWDIAQILSSSLRGLLTPKQIKNIEGRQGRLEQR